METEGATGQTLRTGLTPKKKDKGVAIVSPRVTFLLPLRKESSTFRNKATQSKFRF